MAPGLGFIVWPKPGRVLTMPVGEMAVCIALAERRYCRSIQASSVSGPTIPLNRLSGESRDPLNKYNLGCAARLERIYWVPAFAGMTFPEIPSAHSILEMRAR